MGDSPRGGNFSLYGIDTLVSQAISIISDMPPKKSMEDRIKDLTIILYKFFYRGEEDRTEVKSLIYEQSRDRDDYKSKLQEILNKKNHGWDSEIEKNGNVVFSHNDLAAPDFLSRVSLQLNVSNITSASSLAANITSGIDDFVNKTQNAAYWKFPIPNKIGTTIDDVVIYFSNTLTVDDQNVLANALKDRGVKLDKATNRDIYGMIKIEDGIYYVKEPNEIQVVTEGSGLFNLYKKKISLIAKGIKSHGWCTCTCVATAVILYYKNIDENNYDFYNSCLKLAESLMKITHRTSGGTEVINKDNYLVKKKS